MLDEVKSSFSAVRAQYERWPYPKVSLLASLPREQLWQIHHRWLSAKCGMGLSPQKPRIWIAGCGTFQPYVLARANPEAEILATDLSQRSLDLASRRCRFHGIRNVRFQRIDLQDPSQFPEGPFDWIECYGVLMSLRQPREVLQAFASRLADQGLVRLMVYPHYSRQRIFQVQRLARLLGLHAQERKHPRLLKQILLSLPTSHPLRYAFVHYFDAKNDEGIVDGFLHAADRGFTAFELFEMGRNASLRPSFYFHRPWGQPAVMRDKLGLAGKSDAFVLHYLDLWQELRTNWIVCFTHERSPSSLPTPPSVKHPLLDPENPALGWRDRLRLKRLALTGTSLPSRTHETALQFNARQFRALLRGDLQSLPESHQEVLLREERPVVHAPHLMEPSCKGSLAHFLPRLGEFAPNPLYAHLFDAYFFQEAGLPTLEEQLANWSQEAAILETDSQPFGLTPFGTMRYLESKGLRPSSLAPARTGDFESSALPGEDSKFRELKAFIEQFPDLEQKEKTHSEQRQLWVLLCSQNELFLPFD